MILEVDVRRHGTCDGRIHDCFREDQDPKPNVEEEVEQSDNGGIDPVIRVLTNFIPEFLGLCLVKCIVKCIVIKGLWRC